MAIWTQGINDKIINLDQSGIAHTNVLILEDPRNGFDFENHSLQYVSISKRKNTE